MQTGISCCHIFLPGQMQTCILCCHRFARSDVNLHLFLPQIFQVSCKMAFLFATYLLGQIQTGISCCRQLQAGISCCHKMQTDISCCHQMQTGISCCCQMQTTPYLDHFHYAVLSDHKCQFVQECAETKVRIAFYFLKELSPPGIVCQIESCLQTV